MAVKYIRERNAFYEWLTLNYLSPSAQACWNALFTIYNTKGWPEGWIEAPDMLVRSYMHVSHDTLLDARQQLKSKGLLDFIKGNRRVSSARYRLIWFTENEDGEAAEANTSGESFPQSYPQIIHNSTVCSEISDNSADKPADKPADNVADKGAGNTAGKTGLKPLIYKGSENPYTILDYKQDKTIQETISERVTKQQQVFTQTRVARDGLLSAREKSYADWYSEIDCDQRQREKFLALITANQFTPAQYNCALSFTQNKVERGKVSNPLEYIKTLLIDWDKRGLMEREDIERSLTVDFEPQNVYGREDRNGALGESIALSM